jgi:GAF domain-containing protein
MADVSSSAELQAQLAEAGERERAVREILRTISSSGFDLDQLLQTVIESAVRLSHAEFGNIARLNEATGRYDQAVYFGDVSPEFWAALSRVEFGPDRRTLIGRTLLEGRPVHIHDALEDPEYEFPARQQAQRAQARAAIRLTGTAGHPDAT